jgi:predicted secreted protein
MTEMKTTLLLFTFLLSAYLCHSQDAIYTDTVIVKNTKVNESFELSFEDLPGAGYVWRLPENADTTEVKITPVNKELLEDYQSIGGKYTSTYAYTAKSTGTFILAYYYGRPWLKEKLKKCILKIIAE